jgi:hypothetical protein
VSRVAAEKWEPGSALLRTLSISSLGSCFDPIGLTDIDLHAFLMPIADKDEFRRSLGMVREFNPTVIRNVHAKVPIADLS